RREQQSRVARWSTWRGDLRLKTQQYHTTHTADWARHFCELHRLLTRLTARHSCANAGDRARQTGQRSGVSGANVVSASSAGPRFQRPSSRTMPDTPGNVACATNVALRVSIVNA